MSDVTTTNRLVSLTERAIVSIQKIITVRNKPKFLRIYILGGGCSGFQYGFTFEEHPKQDDVLELFETDITVLIDPLSAQYLSGATIDYVENLQGSQFVVKNPNAQTTCGCGASFAI